MQYGTHCAGRQLHADILSNPTFKWAMIALGGTIGVFLLVALILGIYHFTRANKRDDDVVDKDLVRA